MEQVYEKAEAIINTVVPHLVHLDSMLSAAACYGSQRYFIFQSLFYQLKLHRNTSLCTVGCEYPSQKQMCQGYQKPKAFIMSK